MRRNTRGVLLASLISHCSGCRSQSHTAQKFLHCLRYTLNIFENLLMPTSNNIDPGRSSKQFGHVPRALYRTYDLHVPSYKHGRGDYFAVIRILVFHINERFTRLRICFGIGGKYSTPDFVPRHT